MTYSLESIAQLEHSRAFGQLEQKFNQFNPFKVLRVDQFEIRHSNVLAWLLDPNESHHLGSFFIKKLMTRLAARAENEDKLPGFPYITYMQGSFFDADIYREVKTSNGRYIDLLAVIPSQKLVLVIENKFHASESDGQLLEYAKYARDQYEPLGYTVLPIFLTLNGNEPSCSEYWMLDYRDVLEMIDLHIELNKESMADGVRDFLAYYTSILKEELVPDEEAIQLALDVYQSHQAAIDLLYISGHPELARHPRFKAYFTSRNESDAQTRALERIYVKKRSTVDYIFNIGSNVLRAAFLDFVRSEDIPDGLYKPHISVPSFILPEWLDFAELIGEPEPGYWLGHGLVIWFERTWNDRLKLTIEVGPLPYENRVRLLDALEREGVSFRASAKQEGKKYTRIYTQFVDISDWASKVEVYRGMLEIYHSDELRFVFKQMAAAAARMESDGPSEPEYGKMPEEAGSRHTLPEEAFKLFAEKHGLPPEDYRIGSRIASFLTPEIRRVESVYGGAREKWWWHDSACTFWFERLRDDRLKLTFELGPMQEEKRIALLERLERLGVSFPVKAKDPASKYTRLFSKAVLISDWEDADEVQLAMEHLFSDRENKRLIRIFKEEILGSL